MVKLQKTKLGTFFVTIPKSKVKKFGWKDGQELDWTEYPNSDLVLQKVKEV